MTSSIYLITNLINNKKYVGKSIDPSQRWKAHIKDSKKYTDRYLYRAMNKYGSENFFFEIIEDNIPLNKIDSKEIFWIKELSTRAPNGYNMTDGGDGSVGRKMNSHTKKVLLEYKKNNRVSEGTKKKQSESHKKRYENIEEREKTSKSLIGVPKSSNENYIKMWENISYEEKLVKLEPAINSRRVPILMLDIETKDCIREFSSVREAAKWIRENTKFQKAGHQNISKVCKGNINYVYGYKWCYKYEGVTTIPDGSRVKNELPLEALNL